MIIQAALRASAKMSKITRSALKTIVKECLIEIISEGVGSDIIDVKSPKQHSERRKRKAVRKNVSSHKQVKEAVFDDSFDSATSDAVSDLTSDPIMSDIFHDTARTTLQEQYSSDGPAKHGSSAPIDAYQRQAASTDDVGDLFSSAGKWADLAFADSVK